MAKGDNPFDPNDEGTYLPPAQRQAPQVPISGANPFEPEGGVDRPPSATLLGNVADVLKPASNTFSFGMRDRLEGAYRAMTGQAPSYSEGVNQAVADSAMRRERSPYLSVAGDVAGGTAQAYVPGVGALGRGLSAALGGAGRGAYPTAARMLGYGVEGGALGGAQAAGHTYTENPADYARNAIIGGAFGTVAGAPFGRFADVAPRSLAEVPHSAELKQSATDRYTATHAVPIDYSAPRFWSGVDALEQNLYGTTNQVKSPTVWEVMRLAREGRPQANQPGVVGATVSPKNIDELRQQLTGVREPGAYQARQWLDNFMQDPAAVVRGTDAQRNQIARLLSEARGDYRAGKRTQAFEETNQYAGDRTAVANSGMNAGNTYGQRLSSVFLNPKSQEGRWLTPAEKDEVRAVTRRDPYWNAIRAGGNIMGGGLGLGAGGYGGGGALAAFTTGDIKPLIAGVGIPVTGYGLKSAANRSMVNAAQGLETTAAMRSPLYRERAANAPVVAGSGLGNFPEATRNAITNQILEQARLRGLMQAPNEEQ